MSLILIENPPFRVKFKRPGTDYLQTNHNLRLLKLDTRQEYFLNNSEQKVFKIKTFPTPTFKALTF